LHGYVKLEGWKVGRIQTALTRQSKEICAILSTIVVIEHMKCYFQKPDMDTVLTALILGWQERDGAIHVPDKAPPYALKDPLVYCIECGGAGETHLGNFDHHDTNVSLPAACIQACVFRHCSDPRLLDLAGYVDLVDTGGQMPARKMSGHSLSGVYSGMRQIVDGAVAQFTAGVAIFRTVLKYQIDPWQVMPCLPEWATYMEAKERHRLYLFDYENSIIQFTTKAGLTGGFLSCPLPGAHGFLRKMGCRITIASGLRQSGGNMCTIAGERGSMDGLLAALNLMEPGWGGPAGGGIIGSPRIGSALKPDILIDVVKEVM